jgi:ATP-grasp domain-containing protein
VVKPAVSRWSPSHSDAPAELRPADGRKGTILVQPYVQEQMRAVGGVLWQGEMVAAVHQRYLRTWPPDCGTSSAAESVDPDTDLESKLIALLGEYEGVFQAQLAGPYLLDVNPRPYGSMPLAVASGVNLPALYCDLLRGLEVRHVRSEPGMFYRWVEADLRRLWRDVRGGRLGVWSALRELRPRRGAAHSTESLSDPGPMLARLRFAASRGRRIEAA